MMKARKWLWMGLMTVGATPCLSLAQGPAGIASAAGFGAAPAVGPAVTQPATLWSYLGVAKPQLEACRYKKCATPCGQFLNKLTMPVAAMTGGIIPSFCPIMPSPAELAEQGAVGAAAKIKAEEAQAKARKAAMRYLGTVDCTRFPDAQDALIMGLRGDTNECVRYEAALALGNGCCCTKSTMEALSISASCSDRDGKPREYSDRVRSAAASALARCLSCFVDPNPPKQEKIIEGKPEEGRPAERKPEELKGPATNNTDETPVKDTVKIPAAPTRPVGLDYYRKIESVSRQLIIEEARRVVDKHEQLVMSQANGNRETSLVGIFNRALVDTNSVASPTGIDGGVPVAKAEVVSARPQNLWEMVTRSAEQPSHVTNLRTEATVKSSIEPPTFVKSAPIPMPVPMPMPPRVETMPNFPEPTVVKSEPMVVKPPMNGPVIINGPAEPKIVKSEPAVIKDSAPLPRIEVEPAIPAPEVVKIEPAITKPAPAAPVITNGPAEAKLAKVEPPVVKNLTPLPAPAIREVAPARPKTIAELAAQPRGGNKSEPNQLPELVTGKDQSLIEHESLKPIETAKPAKTKPAEPVGPTPTPLALRALTVLTEPGAPAVREQIAASLSKADFDSCPDIVPVMVELARANEPENTRKAAIQALVRNQVKSPAVISALEKLADEAPPSVRVEAAIGLARLRVGK